MTREEAAMKLATHLMSCGMLMPLGWIDKNGEGSELFEAVKMAQDALRERDALLAEIKDMCHLCRHYNNGNGNGECVNCHDEDNFVWRGAQDALREQDSLAKKQATSDKISDWISVEDRLPDEDVDVLTRRATGIDVEHYMGNDKWWNDCYAGHWVVTHWMPLPEPPEVEG